MKCILYLYCIHLFFLNISLGKNGKALPPYLQTFRNYRRQGGTPGPIPQLPFPVTNATPGLGECVWAGRNAWNGCGLSGNGQRHYNESQCHIPGEPINNLAPPFNNCVAIAWFSWTDWENGKYMADTPTLPLLANYTYVFSFTMNVVIDYILLYNKKFGSNDRNQINKITPNNSTGLWSFTKKDDGDTQWTFGYQFGHPAGNVTVFQEPIDFIGLASYASLFSELNPFFLSLFFELFLADCLFFFFHQDHPY